MRTTTAVLSLLLLAPAVSAATIARPARRADLARMASIPAGSYLPLYRPATLAGTEARVRVQPFLIDRAPVTRGQFLAFVRDNPSWRRGNAAGDVADRAYLEGWRSAVDAGDAAALERPVTEVSWFAAKAYCAAEGKRLPTVDEWEYVAAASETVRDAARDPRFVRTLLDTYAGRAVGDALPPAAAGRRNAYGVRGLHDLVWEWTADGHGMTAEHAAHHRADSASEHRGFCASAAIGAADVSNYAAFMRYAFRAALRERSTQRNLGFRCASGVA